MLSPETEPVATPLSAADDDNPAALIDDSRVPSSYRIPVWIWLLIGVVLLIPIILTTAGAITSPPHVRGVPMGHLIYMDADQPSEHTSNLRGLRIMSPDGGSRLLLHENEDQDIDSGQRDWITQPKASPNGQWLAFEKQNITILEERQGIDNQIWLLSLKAKDPHPFMLIDLDKAGLKQFVGLHWDRNSSGIEFSNTPHFIHVTVPGGHISRTGSFPYGSTPNVQSLPLKWGWSFFGRRWVTATEASPNGRFVAYSVSKPPFENELFLY